ncbi:hypothetical protein PM082_003252 [Marasmius tenuissimus]|nr:hypothetical protein PM082_003252 [Marasmius tenuissimus]
MTGDEVGPWLSQLIGVNPIDVPLNGTEPDPPSFTNPPSYSSSGFQGGFGTHPGYAPPPQSTQNFTPPPPPPPPMSAPPPVPNAPPPPQSPTNGPGTHAPRPAANLVTVALINQTAAQRNCDLKWEPSPPTGPAHAPTWTVRCTINGVEYGRGTGKNTKVAKEEAARIAWANLGWMLRNPRKHNVTVMLHLVLLVVSLAPRTHLAVRTRTAGSVLGAFHVAVAIVV